MNLKMLAVALTAFNVVAGHTVFTTLFVDNVDQGDGTCVRMSMTPNNATNPINDLAGSEMACGKLGYGGATGVARVCLVSQSSKLSFLFRTYADASQVGVIAPSHKGPCAVYMKAVASAVKDIAVGDGWFKIWDEGYDSKASQWCTEKLIKNNGFLSVKVPGDLAGGYYLVRPELLSLHESDKSPPNPQFYVGCAQIFLNSPATSKPQKTVKIPGYITASDPSVLFNIYTPKFPYTLPGPERYRSASGGGTKAKAAGSQNVNTQNEGLLPKNVVLTNANWWGVEVESYTDEDGCWRASRDCWDKCTKCYGTAPPTGSKNCNIWEAKCEHLNNACSSMNLNGPPDAGKDLNPAMPAYTAIPDTQEDIALQKPSTNPTGTTLTSVMTITPTNTSFTIVHITTATTSQPTSALQTSEDTRCGGGTNQTCVGSRHGPCCSANGWCGSNDDYCGNMKCQPLFGNCGNLAALGKRHRQGRAKYC